MLAPHLPNFAPQATFWCVALYWHRTQTQSGFTVWEDNESEITAARRLRKWRGNPKAEGLTASNLGKILVRNLCLRTKRERLLESPQWLQGAITEASHAVCPPAVHQRFLFLTDLTCILWKVAKRSSLRVFYQENCLQPKEEYHW